MVGEVGGGGGVVPLSSECENRLSLLPSFCSPPLPLCLEISTEVPKTVVRASERERGEVVFLGASQIDSVESSDPPPTLLAPASPFQKFVFREEVEVFCLCSGMGRQ